MDIEDYNRRWLQAWTDKDVARLARFYAPDVVYRDPQIPAGLSGLDALTAYLDGLFKATPPVRYTPDEVWKTPTGFCARWYAVMDAPGGPVHLRGFDLAVLEGDRIVLNEVYTHALPQAPGPAA